jgi:hypothetical protein
MPRSGGQRLYRAGLRRSIPKIEQCPDLPQGLPSGRALLDEVLAPTVCGAAAAASGAAPAAASGAAPAAAYGAAIAAASGAAIAVASAVASAPGVAVPGALAGATTCAGPLLPHGLPEVVARLPPRLPLVRKLVPALLRGIAAGGRGLLGTVPYSWSVAGAAVRSAAIVITRRRWWALSSRSRPSFALALIRLTAAAAVSAATAAAAVSGTLQRRRGCAGRRGQGRGRLCHIHPEPGPGRSQVHHSRRGSTAVAATTGPDVKRRRPDGDNEDDRRACYQGAAGADTSEVSACCLGGRVSVPLPRGTLPCAPTHSDSLGGLHTAWKRGRSHWTFVRLRPVQVPRDSRADPRPGR